MIDVEFPKPGRCRAKVWIKDTYRRTGRGKSGFEMHYNACQCKRKVAESDPYAHCWQHRQQVSPPPGRELTKGGDE